MSTSTILRYYLETLQYNTSIAYLKLYQRNSVHHYSSCRCLIKKKLISLYEKMRVEVFSILLYTVCVYAAETTTQPGTCAPSDAPTTEETPIGCVCGVFLSGQFKKGSKEQPKGNPALLHEHPDTFPCSIVGNKLCTNKCLDTIVKHLPNSPAILCGSIDRDCHKERAYLFIKNCKDEWINTNLSAGREYCCKDGLPYKCPILS